MIRETVDMQYGQCRTFRTRDQKSCNQKSVEEKGAEKAHFISYAKLFGPSLAWVRILAQQSLKLQRTRVALQQGCERSKPFSMAAHDNVERLLVCWREAMQYDADVHFSCDSMFHLRLTCRYNVSTSFL